MSSPLLRTWGITEAQRSSMGRPWEEQGGVHTHAPYPQHHWTRNLHSNMGLLGTSFPDNLKPPQIFFLLCPQAPDENFINIPGSQCSLFSTIPCTSILFQNSKENCWETTIRDIKSPEPHTGTTSLCILSLKQWFQSHFRWILSPKTIIYTSSNISSLSAILKLTQHNATIEIYTPSTCLQPWNGRWNESVPLQNRKSRFPTRFMSLFATPAWEQLLQDTPAASDYFLPFVLKTKSFSSP